MIRFTRTRGRCEGCGRPHGQSVFCLDDGRWWDTEAERWRKGNGRPSREPPTMAEIIEMRMTKVVPATAHRDHDTANNDPCNLAAWCQRCHMLHDAPEHRRRRWLTLFRRKVLGDLFRGDYPRA